MNIWEILITSIVLSVDAFTIAVCAGLTMRKVTVKKALIIGSYFGFFQGAMALTGYLLASQFADKIEAYDHWISFVLLILIGGKMIISSFQKKGCKDRECPTDICTDRECPAGRQEEMSLKPKKLLPLAVATSVDAMAIGITMAFLNTNIALAASIIGVITLLLSMIGVKIGNVFGNKFQSKAEFIGGMILVIIGLKILIEHLELIKF